MCYLPEAIIELVFFLTIEDLLPFSRSQTEVEVMWIADRLADVLAEQLIACRSSSFVTQPVVTHADPNEFSYP